MQVKQVLMVTIKPLSHQFFHLKKSTKYCLPNRLFKMQAAKTFPFGSLIFFPNSVSYACFFCFAILSSNLFGRFMHLLTFTVSKTSAVYRYEDCPVTMLHKLSFSIWLKGFIISRRRFILQVGDTATYLRFSFGLAYLTAMI